MRLFRIALAGRTLGDIQGDRGCCAPHLWFQVIVFYSRQSFRYSVNQIHVLQSHVPDLQPLELETHSCMMMTADNGRRTTVVFVHGLWPVSIACSLWSIVHGLSSVVHRPSSLLPHLPRCFAARPMLVERHRVFIGVHAFPVPLVAEGHELTLFGQAFQGGAF